MDLQQPTTISYYQNKEDDFLGDSNEQTVSILSPTNDDPHFSNPPGKDQNVDHASNPSALNKAFHLFHKQK